MPKNFTFRPVPEVPLIRTTYLNICLSYELTIRPKFYILMQMKSLEKNLKYYMSNIYFVRYDRTAGTRCTVQKIIKIICLWLGEILSGDTEGNVMIWRSVKVARVLKAGGETITRQKCAKIFFKLFFKKVHRTFRGSLV